MDTDQQAKCKGLPTDRFRHDVILRMEDQHEYFAVVLKVSL